MKSSKNILLISANRYIQPYPVYPLGLAYISAYLDEHLKSFNVEVFDLNLRSNEQLVNYIKDIKPEYIGISFRNIDDLNIIDSNNFVPQYQEIIKLIKENSDAILIFGGSGFSIYPKEFFKHLNPNFGITGEGEKSLFNLINCIETKSDYKNIDGLVYSDNGNIKINTKSITFNYPLKAIFQDELTEYYWKKGGIIGLQTKRGCPRNCIYCTYPLIEGKKVRTLAVDNVIDILKELSQNKKVNYFFITDSIFNIDDDYNEEFAKKIIENNLKIKWGAYFSPKNLKPDLMKLFHKAGLTHIEFGTESFSNTQLKNYGKNFSFSDVVESTDIANNAGIHNAHFLIFGGPGETEETLNESFENSKKVKNSFFFPFVGMRIYPGTKLEKIAIKEGKIKPNEDLLKSTYYVSEHIDISTLRVKSGETGMRWVFPDEDFSSLTNKLRLLNKKGPVWHLIR